MKKKNWHMREMTAKEQYEQMEQVKERLLELLHYQKNRLAYRKLDPLLVRSVSDGSSPNSRRYCEPKRLSCHTPC